MKISTILDQIDLGTMALPKFQRGYVWNREQVRGLMNSLYRKFPIGSLLVWIVQSDEAVTRGNGPTTPGVVKSLRLAGRSSCDLRDVPHDLRDVPQSRLAGRSSVYKFMSSRRKPTGISIEK